MSQNLCSPLRSRNARKPWPICPDLHFYRCAVCGAVLHTLGDAPPQSPLCCGQAMEHTAPMPQSALGREALDYKVVGGFNHSAVQLFWATPADRPLWAMLQTFTGGYFKHVPEKKAAPLVFPLSDEDAYVYCDRPVCQQCVFRCKKGFVLYAWIEGTGLIELPLDKMEGYFHTKAE